MGRTW